MIKKNNFGEGQFSSQGFTVVETLVSVAILGIFSLALGGFFSDSERSNKNNSARRDTIENLNEINSFVTKHLRRIKKNPEKESCGMAPTGKCLTISNIDQADADYKKEKIFKLHTRCENVPDFARNKLTKISPNAVREINLKVKTECSKSIDINCNRNQLPLARVIEDGAVVRAFPGTHPKRLSSTLGTAVCLYAGSTKNHSMKLVMLGFYLDLDKKFKMLRKVMAIPRGAKSPTLTIIK